MDLSNEYEVILLTSEGLILLGSGRERQELMLAAARYPDIFSIIYRPTKVVP